MPSIHEVHVGIVDELKKMGRGVHISSRNSMFKPGRTPDVYVKGRPFPSEEWVSGHAIREKDGTITIVHDMLCYQRAGFTIDQLGLCDPACWYENFNRLDQERKDREAMNRRYCSCCGKLLDEEH